MKIILKSKFAVIVALSLLCGVVVGCKKDYTCECFIGKQSVGSKSQKMKKRTATEWCESNETEINGLAVSCILTES